MISLAWRKVYLYKATLCSFERANTCTRATAGRPLQNLVEISPLIFVLKTSCRPSSLIVVKFPCHVMLMADSAYLLSPCGHSPGQIVIVITAHFDKSTPVQWRNASISLPWPRRREAITVSQENSDCMISPSKWRKHAPAHSHVINYFTKTYAENFSH